MAFRRLIAEPIRREYNKNHPIDFYEAVNTAYNKVAGFLHKSKDQKETEDYSWCSHPGDIRRAVAVLRSDLADVETISIYSLSSMESPAGGNSTLPGTAGDGDQGLAGTRNPGLEHADGNNGLKEYEEHSLLESEQVESDSNEQEIPAPTHGINIRRDTELYESQYRNQPEAGSLEADSRSGNEQDSFDSEEESGENDNPHTS